MFEDRADVGGVTGGVDLVVENDQHVQQGAVGRRADREALELRGHPRLQGEELGHDAGAQVDGEDRLVGVVAGGEQRVAEHLGALDAREVEAGAQGAG